jgi:hypothetical protein
MTREFGGARQAPLRRDQGRGFGLAGFGTGAISR